MRDKGKYTFSQNGYESGYESEGGTEYEADQFLGSGRFATAWRFTQTEVDVENEAKAIVVLKPQPTVTQVDFAEARRKFNFFNALYPDQNSQLIEQQNSYRLVLPEVPGNRYRDLVVADEEALRKLILSAISALKACYKKGIIVVDLTEDNIHYDETSGISYLIDGGYSVKKGELIHSNFQCSSEESIEEFRKIYPHYAPECFSIDGIKASEKMDVYSLAGVIEWVIASNMMEAPYLEELCLICSSKDPDQRPSLDEIEDRLNNLALEIQSQVLARKNEINEAVSKIENLPVHCEGIQIERNLQACAAFLHEELKKLSKKSYLPEIKNAIATKKNEIEATLRQWKERLAYLKSINFNDHLACFQSIAQAIKPEDRQLVTGFYNALTQAKFDYLESNFDQQIAKINFNSRCKAAIDTIRPILKDHRSLGELIAKFLVDLLSKVSQGWTNCLSVFVEKSNATTELDDLENKLDLGMT